MAELIHAGLGRRDRSLAGLGRLRIWISGCPNSCGQHHVGDIGLTGVVVKNGNGRGKPPYVMMVGGSVGEAAPGRAQRLNGCYPENSAAVAALLDLFSTGRKPGESFAEFVAISDMRVLTGASTAACSAVGRGERG